MRHHFHSGHTQTKPKSRDFGVTSFCDEDVPRLDVTVHDALRVKELALPACLRHAYEHHDKERVASIGTAQHSAKRRASNRSYRWRADGFWGRCFYLFCLVCCSASLMNW